MDERFSNKIILGSKPANTNKTEETLTRSSTRNETEDVKDLVLITNNVSGETKDRSHVFSWKNENEFNETPSTSTAALYNHRSERFPDHVSLMRHLHEVKTDPDDSNNETDSSEASSSEIGNTVDPLGLLKAHKERRIQNIESTPAHIKTDSDIKSNVTDSSSDESEYMYKCHLCNEDFHVYNLARVHKISKHPDATNKQLFFKYYVGKTQTPDHVKLVDNMHTTNTELKKVQKEILNVIRKEEQMQEMRLKLQKHFANKFGNDSTESNVTQDNLKRKITEGNCSSKRLRRDESLSSRSAPVSLEESRNSREKEQKVVKLFKCPCGVHYTSYRSIQKHFKVCRPSNIIPNQNCSKCGYLFAREVIVNHLFKHHGTDPCRFKVIPVMPAMKNVYKCGSCELLFYVELDLIEHSEKCERNNSINSHLVRECNKLVESGYNVVTVNNPDAGKAIFDAKTSERNEDISKQKNTEERKLTKSQTDTSSSKNRRQMSEMTKCVYKCFKCDLHYMTLSNLRRHLALNHKTNKTAVPCEICGLKFPLLTKKAHVTTHHLRMKCQLQDLRIEVVDSIESINRMINDSKKATASNHSQEQRNINRHQDNIASHSNQNEAVNRDRAVTVANKHKAKALYKALKKLSKKKKQPKHSRKLYKCTTCSVHFVTKTNMYEHMLNTVHPVESLKSLCKTCNLEFSSQELAQHVLVHHVQMNLRRESFRIVSKQPWRVSESPQLIHTETTEKNKETISTINEPNNKDITTNGNKNNELVIVIPKLDLKSHKKGDPSTETCTEGENITLDFSSNETNFEDNDISDEPEHEKRITQSKDGDTLVLKKYNLSKTTLKALESKQYDRWLFKCDKCSMHFLHPATLISHRQLSCNPDKITQKCRTCGLCFGVCTLPQHEYIHHEKMKLQLHDFIITTSEFRSADSSDYESNFKRGDETEDIARYLRKSTRESNARSIEDSQKMNNEKQSTNSSKQRSESNDNLVNAIIEVDEVVTEEHSDTNNDSISENSGADFDDDDDPSYEDPELEKGHTTEPEELEHEENDLLSNKEDNKINKYNLTNKRKAVLDSTVYGNTLFKCDRCNIHFLQPGTLRAHYQTSCGPDKPTRHKCSTCGLSFGAISLRRHEYFHHIKMKLQLQDFNIISDFKTPLDNCLYRCGYCSQNFLNRADVRRHINFTLCGRDKAPVFDCSECGLSFTGRSLSLHRYMHHEKMKLQLKDLDIKIIRKPERKGFIQNNDLSKEYKTQLDMTSFDNRLYKCERCSLHFLSMTSLNQHRLEQCDPKDTRIVTCTVCELGFAHNLLARHVYVHHEKKKLERHDFDIITECKPRKRDASPTSTKYTLSNKIRATLDAKTFNNRLYKCERCSLHFMVMATLNQHRLERCDPKVMRIVTCTVCGLEFTRHSLARHMYVHHKKMKLQHHHLDIITRGKRTKRNVSPTSKMTTNNRLYNCEEEESIENLQSETNERRTTNSSKQGSESKGDQTNAIIEVNDSVTEEHSDSNNDSISENSSADFDDDDDRWLS